MFISRRPAHGRLFFSCLESRERNQEVRRTISSSTKEEFTAVHEGLGQGSIPGRKSPIPIIWYVLVRIPLPSYVTPVSMIGSSGAFFWPGRSGRWASVREEKNGNRDDELFPICGVRVPRVVCVARQRNIHQSAPRVGSEKGKTPLWSSISIGWDEHPVTSRGWSLVQPRAGRLDHTSSITWIHSRCTQPGVLHTHAASLVARWGRKGVTFSDPDRRLCQPGSSTSSCQVHFSMSPASSRLRGLGGHQARDVFGIRSQRSLPSSLP